MLLYYLWLPAVLLLLCGEAVGQACNQQCTLSIVESIPENLTYPSSAPSHLSTYRAWMNLLSAATESVDIASYYWTLRGTDSIKDVTDKQGWDVYNKLASFSSSSVKVRIVENIPTGMFPDSDTIDLASSGAALVQKLNFTRLEGVGLLHTKLWVVDQKHFYAGSANMDWRSLTQVKELGILGTDCECLAQDAERLFAVYWNLSSSSSSSVPSQWGPEYTALYSADSPAHLLVNGTKSDVFWSSSPPQLCASQRTIDIDALVNVIKSAEKFVYIAVMDYLPAVIYENPEFYWPVIDDALRSAAYNRGVHVRMLGSYWKHTSWDMVPFLKSLSADSGTGKRGVIEARMFVVPKVIGKDIPFTRVNHNKYMVTDKTAFITTSNWVGDYYTATGGVSCVVSPAATAPGGTTGNDIQQQLLQVFERDWNSPYAFNLTNLPPV